MATINICDVCESREDVERRCYQYDTSYNGTDTDSDSEIFDLCPRCEVKILRAVIYDLPGNKGTRFAVNERIIDRIKLQIKATELGE